MPAASRGRIRRLNRDAAARSSVRRRRSCSTGSSPGTELDEHGRHNVTRRRPGRYAVHGGPASASSRGIPRDTAAAPSRSPRSGPCPPTSGDPPRCSRRSPGLIRGAQGRARRTPERSLISRSPSRPPSGISDVGRDAVPAVRVVHSLGPARCVPRRPDVPFADPAMSAWSHGEAGLWAAAMSYALVRPYGCWTAGRRWAHEEGNPDGGPVGNWCCRGARSPLRRRRSPVSSPPCASGADGWRASPGGSRCTRWSRPTSGAGGSRGYALLEI